MPTVVSTEFRDLVQRLDALLQQFEECDPLQARDQAREVIQAVLDLQAAGWERLLELLRATGEPGVSFVDQCARDEVIGGLLVLHGLHPLDVDARVRQALDQVRPYLHSHGGDVQFIDFEDGIVRLRLEGSCHGCPSSSLTMKQAVEQAILEQAPEVAAIEVEGEAQHPLSTPDGRALITLSGQ